MSPYKIRLAKESFKFSATHFTIFSEREAEALHGHNYQVSVECEVSSLDELDMGFEFNELKPLIKSLVDGWDEKFLLPSRSPHLRLREEDVRGSMHLVIDFADRSYRAPKGEIALINAANVTSESLARALNRNLSEAWKAKLGSKVSSLGARVLTLSVTVEETRGQSATHSLSQPLTASDPS